MLIEGQNLFPLNNITSLGSGYYMSAAGQIFSGKSGKLVRLSGSNTTSGRYFTLSGRTHREDQLVRDARRHKLFDKETAVAGVLEAPKTVKVDGTKRSYASSMQEAITLRGVMIAAVQGDRLIFGTKPKTHITEQSWKDEMTRLATVSPGTKFVAVKIVQSVVAGGVTWA